MLVEISPIFVADTKIIFVYNFVAPLRRVCFTLGAISETHSAVSSGNINTNFYLLSYCFKETVGLETNKPRWQGLQCKPFTTV